MNFGNWRGLFTRAKKSKSVGVDKNIPSFDNMIQDAELLLSYAATSGIILTEDDVAILHRELKNTSFDEPSDKSDTILAVSRIANQLLPVTPEKIRDYFKNHQRLRRTYVIFGIMTIILASGFTLLTFVTSTLSTSMHDDVEYANRMAIELRARLEPSPTMEPAPRSELKVPNTSESPNTELLIHLQEFAILSRSIYAKATQIRFLIPLATDDPFTEMTKKELIDRFLIDPQKPIYDNFGKILDTYQEVRAYAQDLRARVAFWYGGLAASVLPIDYAFLGAIASSLRRSKLQYRLKPSPTSPEVPNRCLLLLPRGQ